MGKDERLEAAMAQLAMTLGEVMPLDELRRRYEFRGDQPLALDEAMRLMDELQQMDQLERQLRRAQGQDDLERIDPFGRTLAYVRLGDELFNETLVRKGYAFVTTYPPNVRYVGRFRAAQREARLRMGRTRQQEQGQQQGSDPSATGV